MKFKIGLPFAVGGLIGLAGAVTGFVIGGLPGEVAGICVAMPIAAVTGIWIGTKT